MRKVITTITLCSIIFSTSLVYGQNKQVDLEKKLTENRNSQLRLDEQIIELNSKIIEVEEKILSTNEEISKLDLQINEIKSEINELENNKPGFGLVVLTSVVFSILLNYFLQYILRFQNLYHVYLSYIFDILLQLFEQLLTILF